MRITLLLSIAFLLLESTAFSQITIKSREGYLPFQELPCTYIKNPGMTMPTEGENMVWDYTNLVACDNCEFSIKYEKKDSLFPKSESVRWDESTVLGHPYPIKFYYGFDDDGDFCEFGAIGEEVIVSAESFTGNTRDRVTRRKRVSTQKELLKDYPLEYGKTWTEVRSDTSFLVVNSRTVRLKNLEVREIGTFTRETTVIGHGDLKLSYWENDEKKYVTYKALLTKKVVSNHFNFSSDASKKLLDFVLSYAGILNNSGLPSCTTYTFEVRELFPYVLSFSKCDDSKTPEIVMMRTDLGNHLPIKE